MRLALALATNTLPGISSGGGGGGVSAIEMDVLFRLTSGTSGNLLDLAEINAATLGAATGWIYGNEAEELLHTKVLDIAEITLPTPFTCAGQTTTSLTKALNFDLTEAVADDDGFEGVQLNQSGNFSAALDDYAFVYIVQPAAIEGGNTVGFDLLSFQGDGYGFPQFRCIPGGGSDFVLHGSEAVGALRIPASLAATYMVSCRSSSTDGTIIAEVTDLGTGQSIGAIRDVFDLGTGLSHISLQDYLLIVANSGGGNIAIPVFGLREATDVFPFRNNYTVPTPTSLDLNQLASDEIAVTFSHLGLDFEIFRSDNGGAYASLGTFSGKTYADTLTIGATTYTDETVEDGHTYLYRVFSKMLGYTSAVAQSDPIEVDNEPFLQGNPIVTGYPSGFEANTPAGFKFTWNTTDKSCTELGFMPSNNSGGSTVITVRQDSDGVVMGTVTFSGSYTPGTEMFAELVAPFTLVNGTVYRLTFDSGDACREAVGVAGFTFSSDITGAASVAPDGSDPVLAACVNLKAL